MSTTAAFVITFALALSLSILIAPLMIRLGKRIGAVAKVDARRTSEGDRRRISKLGGAVIYLSFTITVIAVQFLPIPRFDPNELTRLTGLLLGGTLLYGVGLLDDIFELKAIPLLLAQIGAAVIAMVHLIFIEGFNNPLTGQQTPEWHMIITVGLSLLWLVGMSNTVNWLDGADGLSGSVVLIAAVVLFINSAFELDPPQTSVSLLPLALAGTLTGFLLFNVYPARIFQGGGAFYLGYVLGCLSIIGGAKMATVLMVMGLPLLDAVWQIVSRILTGRNPLRGDRGHLHFRLIALGFSHNQITLGYALFCALFGVLTFTVTSQLFKLISLTVMGAVVFAVIAWAIWREKRTERPI